MSLERRCPKCNGEVLQDFEAGEGLVVDYCAACRGIWCDRGELEELVGGKGRALDAPLAFASGQVGGLSCPGCREGSLEERLAGPDKAICLLDCSRCGGTWLDGGVLPQLRELVDRRRAERWASHPEIRSTSSRFQPPPDIDDEVTFDAPRARALALPVAFLIGLLSLSSLGAYFAYPFRMTFHELGHAVTSWFIGCSALPLPLLTLVGPCGWFVASTLAVILVYVGWHGLQEHKPISVALTGALLGVQVFLTFVLSDHEAQMWRVFGGCGGELLLPALAIVGFYYRAPNVLRWDLLKYLFLVPSAVVFVRSTAFWMRVKNDISLMPYGSFLGNDEEGDMDRLVEIWNWAPEDIPDAYLMLALICGLVIVGHYVYFQLRAKG